MERAKATSLVWRSGSPGGPRHAQHPNVHATRRGLQPGQTARIRRVSTAVQPCSGERSFTKSLKRITVVTIEFCHQRHYRP